MHVPDGFLSPPVWGSLALVGGGALAVAATKARQKLDDRTIPTLGVLGAFVFAADLGREIRKAGGPETRYDFIRASAYGAGVKENNDVSREVRLELIPDDVKGRDVLLVEDILDQGFTLARIRKTLLDSKGARSVRLCVLLEKVIESPAPG